MYKIKIDKKKGLLYGILLIIPCGIPIILLIELAKKIRKHLDKSKDIRTLVSQSK